MNRASARLYFRDHYYRAAAVLALVVVAIQLAVGSAHIALPNSQVIFPYRSLLPVGLVIAVLRTLSSDMSDFNRVAAQRLARIRTVALVGMFVTISSVEILVGSAIATSDVGIVYARSFVIWGGLGLLAFSLIGPRLSWVLPIASGLPLTYFDTFAGNKPAWWNWPLQTVNSWQCWLIAAIVMSAAAVALFTTRWRLRNWTRGHRKRKTYVGRRTESGAVEKV